MAETEIEAADINEIIMQTLLDVKAIRLQGPADLDRIERVIAKLMDGYAQILALTEPPHDIKGGEHAGGVARSL